MHFTAVFLSFLFLIISTTKCEGKNESSFVSEVQDKFGFSKYADIITKWLEKFNDKHLGNSEIGRFLHYNELKPKIDEIAQQGRNMKKLTLALIPLIFHVGVSSTWMLVTMLLAAKSVAIGMLLLIFKIAVSSAKVASYFTTLKSKHHHEWTPHYEHHGHKRSFSADSHPTYLEHPPADWPSSYNAPWSAESSPPLTAKSSPVYQEASPYYVYDAKKN